MESDWKFISGGWEKVKSDGEKMWFFPVAKTFGHMVVRNKNRRTSKDPKVLMFQTFPKRKNEKKKEEEPDLDDDLEL